MPTDGPLDWAESWATAHADDLALAGAGLRLTAGEMWDSALRISRGLADAGVAPGDVVALAGPAVLRPLLGLGALARGAVGVGVQPGLEAPRIVTFDPLPGVPPERMVLLDLPVLSALPDPSGAEHPGRSRDPDAPALIVASSGTTGAPKGVVFSTAQVVRRVAAARRVWLPDAPFASLLGPGSMSGQVSFLAALARRTTHLVPGTAAQNLAQLRDHGIHVVKGSPAQLAQLLRTARRAGERLPALEIVEAAGSPISRSLAADLAGWFATAVRGLYGATEAGTVAIVDDATRDENSRLLPHAEVRIVNGLVHIRTDGLASGYLGGPAREDRGFVDGWFVPGDLGRIDDGRLTLLGREDDLLNAAGLKIAPERVEAAALALPGIEDAAACAVVDGSGVRQIALAIVGAAGGDPSALVAALRPALGDATPRIVVRLAAIPRTEPGKIARATLSRDVEGMLRPTIDLELP